MRIILVLGALGLLSACGSTRPAGGALAVVAAENAYGDIAAQIGGPHVSVSSLLSDPNADPHLFGPDTRNELAVAQARLVIENGAGYDAFMARLEAASPAASRIVVTIAEALGAHGHDVNPHLWYDVPKLAVIAAAIERGLERADPAHAAGYRTRLRRFTLSSRPLLAQVRLIRTRFAGLPVAYTEPVPGYLVQAAGLRNLAPSSFTRAIENGSEPSPQAVSAMQSLLRTRAVRVLLYNSQAVSPLTAHMRDLARHAGIPVVGVTETLPRGMRFQQWQLAQARALYEALAR